MIGERFERDAGRLAVEQPSFAQIRLQRAARSEGAPLSAATTSPRRRRGDRGPGPPESRFARRDPPCRRPYSPLSRADPCCAARQKIGEAEPAARHEPRGAGHVEVSAGHPVEDRIVGREFRRMRVEGRAQRAIARRAVEIGGDARLALERAPGEQREPAQVARDDVRLAVKLFAGEQAGIMRVEIGRERSSVSNVASPPDEAEPRIVSLSSRPTAWANAGSASARPFTEAWPSNRIRVVSSTSGPFGAARKVASTRSTDPCSTRISAGVESAVDRRARKRSLDRCVEVQFPDRVEPGMAPAWTLKPSRSFADLPPSKSSRAAADTRCRPPGRAMLELSLN